MAHLAKVTPRMVPDAGHMLHHDQPELLARMLEEFLAEQELDGSKGD
jgi:pimeloyl-ACP methyl ester carboxylesterase